MFSPVVSSSAFVFLTESVLISASSSALLFALECLPKRSSLLSVNLLNFTILVQ